MPEGPALRAHAEWRTVIGARIVQVVDGARHGRSAGITLSTWRHGFESRWGCQHRARPAAVVWGRGLTAGSGAATPAPLRAAEAGYRVGSCGAGRVGSCGRWWRPRGLVSAIGRARLCDAWLISVLSQLAA